MLAIEQKKRVDRFTPGFYEYLKEGTLNHCRRLYADGMVAEALEIGSEFNIKKEDLCQYCLS